MNKETNPLRELIEVKPYNQKELCILYRISSKTFKKWLHPFSAIIGQRNGRLYSVLQVELIFRMLGVPYWVDLSAAGRSLHD